MLFKKIKNESKRPGYTIARLCFPGFYNSLLAARLDMQLEGDAEYCELRADDLIDAVDWRRAHELIAREYTDYFGEWLFTALHEIEPRAKGLHLEFTFHQLTSPREYNFETDCIEAECKTADLRRLFDHLMLWHEDDFRAYWRKVFTPSSGWIPFYPADLDACGPCENWPACLWQVVFDFVNQMAADEQDSLEAEEWFDEEALAHGYYSDALCASPDYVALLNAAEESKEA